MTVIRHKRFFDPTIEKLKETAQLKLDKDAGRVQQTVDYPSLYEPIPEPFIMPGFELSVDSGAHTLYKSKFVQGDQATEYARMTADYSYLNTPEFKTFLDDYIQHLLINKDLYTFYVTLDIINNPQKSWEITKYIESYGLHPIPVFHNGEDIHWLHKMLDEYPYLGISGLGQDITKQKFKNFGDQCFNAICDGHGTPRVKVHGFAMGTPEILRQYPWYSADSSTWTYMSRVGSLLVPKPVFHHGKITGFDYLSKYKVLPVTKRRRFEPLHVKHVISTLVQQWFQAFLEPEGFTMEEAQEFYHVRDILNIRLFSRIQTAAKELYKNQWDYEQGGNILFAGTPAGASSNLSRLCRLLYDVKINNMHWLGSPIYRKVLNNCLTIKQATLAKEDYRSLWSMEDARLKADPTINKPKIAPRPIKKKIERKLIVKPERLYKVSVEVSIPMLTTDRTKALTQIIEELTKQYPGITVTHKTTELIPSTIAATDTSSFENLL